MNNAVKLFHPLCHYINCERLYFILISFRSDVIEKSNEFVKNIQSEFPCFSSSCIYSIFGDLDILVRLWASHQDIDAINLYLNSLSDDIRSYRLILVDHAYTWYQYEIDKKLSESAELSVHNFDVKKILKKDFGLDQKYIYLKSDGPKDATKYKIWLVVEDKSSSYTDLFNKVIESIYKKHRDKLISIGTDRISIYSYQMSTGNGLIIKADTKDFFTTNDIFYDVIEELNNITIASGETSRSRQRDYKIMTYIACEPLKKENDSLYSESCKSNHLRTRKQKCIENLCKLQDCSPHLFEEESLEYENSILFSNSLVPLFFLIFHYRDISIWTKNIEKLRILYKCIVENQNKKLKSFLMREYVKLESIFRDEIEDYFDQSYMRKINGFDSTAKEIEGRLKVKYENVEHDDIVAILDILEKNHAFQSKITLGLIPRIINRLPRDLERSKLPKDVKSKLNDVSKKISLCANDRNKLMHGEINNLFQQEDENLLWIVYIKNFVEFRFKSDDFLSLLVSILTLLHLRVYNGKLVDESFMENAV